MSVQCPEGALDRVKSSRRGVSNIASTDISDMYTVQTFENTVSQEGGFWRRTVVKQKFVSLFF